MKVYKVKDSTNASLLTYVVFMDKSHISQHTQRVISPLYKVFVLKRNPEFKVKYTKYELFSAKISCIVKLKTIIPISVMRYDFSHLKMGMIVD